MTTTTMHQAYEYMNTYGRIDGTAAAAAAAAVVLVVGGLRVVVTESVVLNNIR